MNKKEDITANIMLVQVRGLSVFGTGHEFNDRNSGLEPNSLLIRTKENISDFPYDKILTKH